MVGHAIHTRYIFAKTRRLRISFYKCKVCIHLKVQQDVYHISRLRCSISTKKSCVQNSRASLQYLKLYRTNITKAKLLFYFASIKCYGIHIFFFHCKIASKTFWTKYSLIVWQRMNNLSNLWVNLTALWNFWCKCRLALRVTSWN